MPAEFALDSAKRIVRSRAWGHLTEEDLMEHIDGLRALFEDGTLDASWAHIMDFSAVDTIGDSSTDAVNRLAQSSPWPKEARRALIMPTDLLFGLGRMYQLMEGEQGENIRVVRSEKEAFAWVVREKRAN